MNKTERGNLALLTSCLKQPHQAPRNIAAAVLLTMAAKILRAVSGRRKNYTYVDTLTAVRKYVDSALDNVDEPETPQLSNADEALFRDALANGRGPDQQRIAETVLRIGATLLRKNADYGGSAWQPPVLAPSMNAGDAIRVRMSDKIHRLAALSSKAAEVNESIDDTLSDLAGYCILELARPVVSGYESFKSANDDSARPEHAGRTTPLRSHDAEFKRSVADFTRKEGDGLDTTGRAPHVVPTSEREFSNQIQGLVDAEVKRRVENATFPGVVDDETGTVEVDTGDVGGDFSTYDYFTNDPAELPAEDGHGSHVSGTRCGVTAGRRTSRNPNLSAAYGAKLEAEPQPIHTTHRPDDLRPAASLADRGDGPRAEAMRRHDLIYSVAADSPLLPALRAAPEARSVAADSPLRHTVADGATAFAEDFDDESY